MEHYMETGVIWGVYWDSCYAPANLPSFMPKASSLVQISREPGGREGADKQVVDIIVQRSTARVCLECLRRMYALREMILQAGNVEGEELN